MESEGNVKKGLQKLSTIYVLVKTLLSIVREERKLCNKQHRLALICLASEMDWKWQYGWMITLI